MSEHADFGRLAAAVLNQPWTSVRAADSKRMPLDNDDDDADLVTTVLRPPPPLPKPRPREDDAPDAVLVPAFMVLRGGAAAPPGLASSLPFLALLVLAVVLVTIAGFALLGPTAELLRG